MAYKYEEHMTRKYDTKFRACKDLLWDPWVGVDYDRSGIFILGMSTDQRDGEDWTQNLPNPRDASRNLVANVNTEDGPPFIREGANMKAFFNMSNIFIIGAGLTEDEQMYTKFWRAVAFNNYYQVVVPNMGDTPEQPDDITKSKSAFDSTADIIKPKLILAWTTQLWKLGLEEDEYKTRDEKVNGACPRVSRQPPFIIGIKHPSRIRAADWLAFLLADDASKKPISDFVQYLKQQPN